MASVKIDPNTGSPIVANPITPIDSPSTDKSTKDSTDKSNELMSLPELRRSLLKHKNEERVPATQTREEFLDAVSDILKRYTSDTQSHQKAFAEVQSLVPFN